MNKALIFPTIIIILNCGAAFIYAATGDARHAVYWFAAAVLNAAITY